MRIRTLVSSFAGAVTIYVVMAACGGSGSSSDPAAMTSGGTSGSGTSGASMTSGGASGTSGGTKDGDILDALIDRLTNPVPDAKANPPTIAVETCDKTSGAVSYAEHAFPGKLINDLAGTQVVLHTTSGAGIPGYNSFATTPLLRDGFVAITCGSAANPAYDSVTFILP